MLAPRMSNSLHAILHERYDLCDPDIPNILQWMRDQEAFSQFAHGRDPFYTHLKGTWSMLSNWNQAPDIARCGLFHSAYTRHGFYFRYFDMNSHSDRSLLANVIGTDAEHNVFKYCSAHQMWDVRWYFGATPTEWKRADDLGMLPPETHWDDPFDPNLVRMDGSPLNKAGYSFASRVGPNSNTTIHFTPEEVAKYLIVFCADLADQQTDVTSYVSVYHPPNDAATRLWPGTGKPGMVNHTIGVSFFSRILKSSAPFLNRVPSIFNNCTSIQSQNDEYAARELYWNANQGEHTLTKEIQEEMYCQSIVLNPYLAEPRIALCQLLYNRGEYERATNECSRALRLLYQWGTQWDKRMSYGQWIGFARMMHMKSIRKRNGELNSLPSLTMEQAGLHHDANNVTFLQDVLLEYEKYTEGGTLVVVRESESKSKSESEAASSKL